MGPLRTCGQRAGERLTTAQFQACYAACTSTLRTKEAWNIAIAANAAFAMPYEFIPVFDYDTGKLRGMERHQSEAFKFMKKEFPLAVRRLFTFSTRSSYVAAGCLAWSGSTAYACTAQCLGEPSSYAP
jgi:hypothetical protein